MPDEKGDEKEMEKREEKAPEEKNWDEKWRRDPLSAVVWAAIFIWAGLVLLAETTGYLNTLNIRGAFAPESRFLAGATAWSLIALGAGVIVIIEIIVRILVPAYRRPITGSLILAVILIGIGLGNLWNWDVVWPLILIILGLSILTRGLMRRR